MSSHTESSDGFCLFWSASTKHDTVVHLVVCIDHTIGQNDGKWPHERWVVSSTQIRPLYQVLLGKKVFRGESPDCQSMNEGLDARTEKGVSV